MRVPQEKARIRVTIHIETTDSSVWDMPALLIPYFLLALAQKVWLLAGRDPPVLFDFKIKTKKTSGLDSTVLPIPIWSQLNIVSLDTKQDTLFNPAIRKKPSIIM